MKKAYIVWAGHYWEVYDENGDYRGYNACSVTLAAFMQEKGYEVVLGRKVTAVKGADGETIEVKRN